MASAWMPPDFSSGNPKTIARILSASIPFAVAAERDPDWRIPVQFRECSGLRHNCLVAKLIVFLVWLECVPGTAW